MRQRRGMTGWAAAASVLLLVAAGWAQGSLTTITDTVLRADGTPAAGTLLITWPGFTTASAGAVAAGSTSVTIGAGGLVSFALSPNAGSNPASYYTVVYNLFDLEVGQQQSQFAYLQAKDLADSVSGLLRTHDQALWNGTDTSLSTPTTNQYFGVTGQITAGGQVATAQTTDSIVDIIKSQISTMMANSGYEVRPTAIYVNPVLADLIDREIKSAFNVVLNTMEITAGLRVKALATQAGELPIIPDWSLPYTGTVGSGTATLPAYIVSEDLIEYHWLTDPNPRVFRLGLTGTLASQLVVVKFGAVVVKGANYAHALVNVKR